MNMPHFFCPVSILFIILAYLASGVYAENVPKIVVAGFRSQHEAVSSSDSETSRRTRKEWLHRLLEEEEGGGAHHHRDDNDDCILPRYASAESIMRFWDRVRKRHKSFRLHKGADGRFGRISSTNLGQDWVLAESEQIAVECTPSDVLRAYLTGSLQKIWNVDSVLDCQFTLVDPAQQQPNDAGGGREEPYYRQDLVLKSQRVIRRHTGVMRYAQRIVIDQVGEGDATNYCVRVTLLDDMKNKKRDNTTRCLKPFQALHVFVHLSPRGNDTHIYAAGIFQVNRRVVPNLVVFDAAGIAGSMAGKGTLWLAAHFKKQQEQRLLENSGQKTAANSIDGRDDGDGSEQIDENI
eukprot:scaffold1328_cov162-Amphora_coffeaeformis.AAC.21